MKKIIIDTNIWISAFLKTPYDIFNLITNNNLKVFACKELRNEIKEVMSRKKFEKFFSKEDIDNALILFDNLTETVDLQTCFLGCPDVNDDYLFALAKQMGSIFLITGDKILLNFKTDFVYTISLTDLKNILPLLSINYEK